MIMKNSAPSSFMFRALLAWCLCLPVIIGELNQTEVLALHRLRRILENPEILQEWSRRSDLCSITPSASVSILCSRDHVTELSLFGTGKSLSQNFSISSLFATVSKLPKLTKLSLVSLGIWGLLPKHISPSSSLRVLNLSSNHISGTIQDLSRTHDLRMLDISANKFIGCIPPSLFSLPSVQYLDFGGNELSGALPANTSCGEKLEFVDVSNNLLFGELPPCLRWNTSNRVVLYSWNCFTGQEVQQHPSVFCHREALAVKPPYPANIKNRFRCKIRIAIGVVVASIAVIAVIGMALLLIRRSRETQKSEAFPLQNSPRVIFGSRHLPRTLKSAASGLPSYQIFTVEQIEQAIADFDALNSMENDHRQAQLRSGCLRDGTSVTVKSLNLTQRGFFSPENLLHYVDVVSKLRHLNLVSVIGHCIGPLNEQDGSTFFIVFEDATRCSLRDYLADGRKRELLIWPRRINIVLGIATAIHFLHTQVSPPIFGNDLNSENILLDDNLTPKITNYRLPSPSEIASESHSSNGEDAGDRLNAPKNAEEKGDVYKLGIILLETLTGSKIQSESERHHQKDQMEKALMEAPSAIGEAVDASLRGTYAYQSLRIAVEMTVNCLHEDPRKRPTMEDVLWNLKYSFQVQEAWSASENLSGQP